MRGAARPATGITTMHRKRFPQAAGRLAPLRSSGLLPVPQVYLGPVTLTMR